MKRIIIVGAGAAGMLAAIHAKTKDNQVILIERNTNCGKKILITDSSLTSNDRTTSESTTVIAQDAKGNQVVVPGGFKISSDSGTSVEQGIVIEDKDGNQFVWVPVSNINGDESNKIKNT